MCLGVILGILILLVKGFFTAAEAAVIEMNDSKLKKLSETDQRAKALLNIMSKPNRLLVSLSAFRAFSAVVFSITSALVFFEPLDNKLATSGLSGRFSKAAAILIIVFFTTIFLVVFSESIPKKLAHKNSEKFALGISGFLRVLICVFAPLSAVVSGLTFVFGKLFGFSISSGREAVTEEEILLMVDAVNETGGIEESQREMINNIFEFDDLEVSDVMTHRTDITAVEKNASVMNVVELAIAEGFSRIPVYDNTIDNITGVIYVKDLLRLIGSESSLEQPLNDFSREILYIPETNRCGELFKEFTKTKSQIAVAVDEYGGTAGLVTMEDLLEAIVGSIQDEYDDEIEEIIQLENGEYEISGIANPDAVFELFGITLPAEHDYDTIGGFVVDILGYIPGENEFPKAEYENVRFTVLSTNEKRIEKLRAALIPAPPLEEI
jgi:putative hemolysin